MNARLIIQFSPSINLCRSGYSRNLKGEQTPQTFDAWQRQRRKVRRRGVIDTVCWMVNRKQCGQLEQFHRQVSGNYFEIDLPAYSGVTKTAARFDGPLTINPVRDHYEITASLYIPQPPIMPDDELAGELLDSIGITDLRTVIKKPSKEIEQRFDSLEQAVDKATTEADRAGQSAEAAAARESASHAGASQQAAAASANNASANEQGAGQSEEQASVSAASASASASAARASETAAAASATAAKASETAAHNATTATENSENNAATSAATATEQVSAAKASATKAKASETAAANSASQAQGSSTSAGNSATNALNSANKAKASETAAQQAASTSQTSEKNAEKNAANAKGSETAAVNSASTATQQADRSESEADRAKAEADRAVKASRRIVGEICRFSFDTPPAGFFALDGSTIPNGKIDFPELANSGSRFITVSGNNLILKNYLDFGRGRGSSERSIGEFEQDAIRNITGKIITIKHKNMTDTGASQRVSNLNFISGFVMRIEKRISLTEAELKAAISQYLKFCDLKPNEPIRFVFRNGESVEQVLFTDIDVIWTKKACATERIGVNPCPP